MTKSEYVRSKLTKLDILKLNSIVVPAALVALFVLYGMIIRGGDFNLQEGRIFISLFVITGFISGVLHTQAENKKNRYIEMYDEMRRKGEI